MVMLADAIDYFSKEVEAANLGMDGKRIIPLQKRQAVLVFYRTAKSCAWIVTRRLAHMAAKII